MQAVTGSAGVDQPIVLPGRTRPLRTLRECILAPAHGVLRGEAGIGKSALLGLALRDVDAVVVHGVAALAMDAYAPLRVVAPALDLVGEPGAVAQKILGWLGRTRPFVVDDVQWCDTDTLGVLAELAYLRPVVVVTRPDPGNAGDLIALLAEAGDVIDLDPLSRAAATKLVRQWRPRAPAGDLERAVAAAAGNPLVLFVASGGAAAGSSASEAARHAVATVSDSSIRTLARAALAGRAVSAPREDAAELRRSGLATVGANGRLHPRHDLFAQAAIDAVDPETRAGLHRELALDAATDLDRARHFARAGLSVKAVEAATAAAAGAPTIGARAEALLIAATAAAPASEPAQWEAAEALCLAGRYREALDLVAGLTARSPHDELVRARAHWAITESVDARRAIAAGLAFLVVDPSDAAELLSLDSRIRTREDWDLDGGMSSAERAVALASAATGTGANAARVAANSALGLARLMAGAEGWAESLETAGSLAMRESDLHNAVTVYDTMIYGQLLSGDPRLCAGLVADMVEFTEQVSAAWNRYFAVTGLLVALHVEGDHVGVLREVAHVARQHLSVRTQEMLRTVRAFALVDNGYELDAVAVATEAVELASDDSARATALWALADAQLAGGLHEDAVRSADVCAGLPVQGFPGSVNATLAGARARVELGLDLDGAVLAEVFSGFPNLRAAVDEVTAIGCEEPQEAVEQFMRAAGGWCGVSARSELRCRWSAADAALRAGDRQRAVELVDAIDDDAPVWLHRRADATRRLAGAPVARSRPDTAGEVMVRVARGLTTKQIARALAVSPSTVETHVRTAMTKWGATTRVQAAIDMLSAAAETRDEVVVVRGAGGGLCFTPGASARKQSIALDALEQLPWQLDGCVVRGEVRDTKDISRVALARVRGAALDVTVHCEPGVEAELVDALERTGGARLALTSVGTLLPADVELLALLAGGATVRDIGSRLGYSARTVQRRLAGLRREFGVATNREVVVAAGLR